MALPTWYDTGTVSVANGSALVTGTGTLWGGDAIMPGDLFCDQAQPLVPPQRIASVEANGELTLAGPWPGTSLTDEAYEIRFVGIIERSTAQTRRVLEQLGEVSAYFDIQVDDTAARLALESVDAPLRANYRVLVSDIGDGTAAIYSKASSVYDDWTAPAPYSGPVGPAGPTGPAAITWEGAYDPGTTYAIDAGVRFNGSTFRKLTSAGAGNAPSSASPPVDNTNWEVVAAKGADGAGTGDVVGPASATDGALAVFDGTTGKLVKVLAQATIGSNGDLTLVSTDAGAAAGPNLILHRNSGSPAVSDVLGAIVWRGRDNAATDQVYANIVPVINDQTSTSEDAELRLQTVAAGTVGDRLVVRGGSGVYSYFSGDLLVGKSAASNTDPGTILSSAFGAVVTVGAGASQVMMLNRQGDDGTLISLRQANVEEGAISVSGTTVTYGSFCGSHWSQLAGGHSRPPILRGTIVEAIDEMCAWENEQNDQLAKFKISDTPGSRSVYGVFANWTGEGDANIAGLGAFLIRINGSVTVANGDLIESNGDGTGRVQSDDVVRSKTVAKITSTRVVEVFGDGSYLVPCTLHCG